MASILTRHHAWLSSEHVDHLGLARLCYADVFRKYNNWVQFRTESTTTEWVNLHAYVYDHAGSVLQQCLQSACPMTLYVPVCHAVSRDSRPAQEGKVQAGQRRNAKMRWSPVRGCVCESTLERDRLLIM